VLTQNSLCNRLNVYPDPDKHLADYVMNFGQAEMQTKIKNIDSHFQSEQNNKFIGSQNAI
jgi:hypothetical protein